MTKAAKGTKNETRTVRVRTAIYHIWFDGIRTRNISSPRYQALEWAQFDGIDWRAKIQKRPLISWQRNCHRKYTSRIVHFLSSIAVFGNKSSPHFLVYLIIKLNLERYVPLIMMIRSRYSCENTVMPISMKCSPHLLYLHHHLLSIGTTLWLLDCEE